MKLVNRELGYKVFLDYGKDFGFFFDEMGSICRVWYDLIYDLMGLL